MTTVPPAPLLSYGGGRLDRAAAMRKDDAWIAERWNRADSLIVPLWRDLNLVVGHDAIIPDRASAPAVAAASGETVFLGLRGDVAIFAADLSDLDEAQATETAGAGTFIDLRQVGQVMDAEAAALLAYARGMAHWHRHHRFCGACGQPTDSRDGGHLRRCRDDACGGQIFPRTDPAVIMLVVSPPAAGDPPRCLMGRHLRLPRGVYSTLAGFVEPGESLEDTVAREVFEETGIVVGDVAYQGSQPWPFPRSMMLGFRAQAKTMEITIDRDELDDARWFSAADVAEFGEWADEDAERRLPRRDSIARYLLDTWLAEVSRR
jgi:NAD+ diphosphatase